MKFFLALLLAQGFIWTSCQNVKKCKEFEYPIWTSDNAQEAIRFAGM